MTPYSKVIIEKLTVVTVVKKHSLLWNLKALQEPTLS